MSDLATALRRIRSDCERLNSYAGESIRLTPARYFSLLVRPEILVLALHRIANVLHGRGRVRVARWFSRVGHALTGADIHPASEVGSHCLIVHTTGVVLHGSLGSHASIFAQIRVAPCSADSPRVAWPTIGDHVVLASRVRVEGPISVADAVHVAPFSLIDQSILRRGCFAQRLPGKPLRLLDVNGEQRK